MLKPCEYYQIMGLAMVPGGFRSHPQSGGYGRGRVSCYRTEVRWVDRHQSTIYLLGHHFLGAPTVLRTPEIWLSQLGISPPESSGIAHVERGFMNLSLNDDQ